VTEIISAEERARIRSHFPALGGDTIYLENAGGSQVPRSVADRISDYMLHSYVQVGAGYPLSRHCTRIVEEAHDFATLLMNGSKGHVILGPSSSALLHMLAECYAEVLLPGQEVVVAETGHEANIGPWKMLKSCGLELRWWWFDPDSGTCPIEELEGLVNERTALVALPHVSNLLGDIIDIQAVTEIAHRAGARVVVDGVAYAPHRAIDVAAWNVDWYAFSTYKVYGPHMAALYGRRDAVEELHSPNHFFIPEDEMPHAFELGGVNHEGCAGLLGVADYFKALAGLDADAVLDRDAVIRVYGLMTRCELPLQQRLIEYLQARSDVRLVGPAEKGRSRVGTISFVHQSKSSREITRVVDGSGIAIRNGHMYAYHLCEALGLDPEDGVVRISLVHYNTPKEIERLIEVLERALVG
jgi:cysteine desulfurase family protein (TIGR01976 family)